MNKLVACALLGFGLTQVLVGCSDDDDAAPGASGSGTAGSSAGKGNAGSSNAGTSNGGNGSAGKTGSTAGTGGNATAGTAGTGGSATAGTTSGGGEGGVAGEGGSGAGEGGMAGEAGMAGSAGDGGMAGAGGAPPVEPQAPTPIWLSHYCEAKSAEVLMCETSPEFAQCYTEYRPYLSTVQEGICPGEEAENDPLVKTLALYEAIDALAAACPDPDVDQWQCTFSGAAQAKDQTCRDADTAARVAYSNCNP